MTLAQRIERRMIASGAPSEEVIACLIELTFSGVLKERLVAASVERQCEFGFLIADILEAVLRDDLVAAVLDA